MLINFSDLYKKYNMSITGIIHIGAHYGEELEEYSLNNIPSIVLFEPLTANFRVLEQRATQFNMNIIGHQVALGNGSGKVEMFLSSNQQESSSILKPKIHLDQYPNITFNETEAVILSKLDDYNYKDYNFINMDVQGYELEVLKGSTETLKFVDYVYCEVNRDEVYENNALVEQLDEFLKPYNFNRVETEWVGDTWGDALYIKSKNEN
jgi:FkbM family methyltransferase